MTDTRFRELDGLRGLAASAVLVAHFTGSYNSFYVDDPRASFDFPQGAFGVQLFFLISGFVILMSASRARRPSDFVISRVSRIYPAYWLSLILAIVIGRLFQTAQSNASLLDVIANVSMFQRFLQIPNLVDVYWTLAIELQFYMLVLALLLITRCRLTESVLFRMSLLWIACAVAVAIWAGPYSRGIDPQNVVTPVKMVLNLTLAEFGPLFCCGMWAYLSRQNAKPRWMMFFTAVISIIVAALLHSWAYGALVAVICAGFILIVLQRSTPWLNFSVVQWLGKISYSLYVVHATVGFVVIRTAWPYVGRDIAIIFATIASVLLSWAIYTLGEKHGSAKFKQLLLRLRDRRVRSRGPS